MFQSTCGSSSDLASPQPTSTSLRMLVLIPTGEYPIAGQGHASRAIDAPASSHAHEYSARAPHLAATSMIDDTGSFTTTHHDTRRDKSTGCLPSLDSQIHTVAAAHLKVHACRRLETRTSNDFSCFPPTISLMCQQPANAADTTARPRRTARHHLGINMPTRSRAAVVAQLKNPIKLSSTSHCENIQNQVLVESQLLGSAELTDWVFKAKRSNDRAMASHISGATEGYRTSRRAWYRSPRASEMGMSNSFSCQDGARPKKIGKRTSFRHFATKLSTS